MAYKQDEQTVSADIPAELSEIFDTQRRDRGQVKKDAVRAMIRLWVELPEEIQAKLLNQKLAGSAFLELVQSIVDERIEAGRKAGKAILARQKRKRPRKG